MKRKMMALVVIGSLLSSAVLARPLQITNPTLLSSELNSSNGSFCYGYARSMQTVYKSEHYADMSEYYGQYFDRLQSQEYGKVSADIMLSYSELGQYIVDASKKKSENIRKNCEDMYLKFKSRQ